MQITLVHQVHHHQLPVKKRITLTCKIKEEEDRKGIRKITKPSPAWNRIKLRYKISFFFIFNYFVPNEDTL